jgi:hypothetical protein
MISTRVAATIYWQHAGHDLAEDIHLLGVLGMDRKIREELEKLCAQPGLRLAAIKASKTQKAVERITALGLDTVALRTDPRFFPCADVIWSCKRTIIVSRRHAKARDKSSYCTAGRTNYIQAIVLSSYLHASHCLECH